MDPDDTTLVERCRAGDVSAFEPLVEKYRQRVWRLALRFVRDQDEAWDVAQEAFVRAWQALPNFKGQSAFYTWLFRIAVNVASDRLRQRGARARAFGAEQVSDEEMARTVSDTAATPDETATRAEQRERIMRGLRALPEHHRTIIMLSDLDGLSYREISEVLQIPMGTVMSRLHNARKRLRDVLGPILLVLLTIVGVLAHGGAEAERVVRFGARVVLAGDGPPPPGTRTVPPPTEERLARVLPKLRQIFRYREYTWLDRFRAEVPIGTTQRWSVPGGRQLEVTPQGVAGDAVRMRVRLMRGSLNELSTDIQAASGQPAVIGGPRHGDGVLIIIVWANANPR
ncbi:MAG: sigma-70 family RNA polymerase sigma factor [Candidatus Rokubacteria bacterium]|nr:sigma-70 family RNA polymerase sigma factor [Candidatus Rokubacteria bacterium]